LVISGFAVYFLAGPVAPTIRLNAEEYAHASQLDVEGQQYKGRDFLDWRYGWLNIMFSLWYLTIALVVAGSGLGIFHSYRHRQVISSRKVLMLNGAMIEHTNLKV
jgi:hypothetical protein